MARFYNGRRVSGEWQSVLLAAEIDRCRVLDLNSGRRTMAEQARLRAAYVAHLNGGPWAPLAAIPSPTAPHIRVGRADHALDISTIREDATWFDRWCTERGMALANTVSGEPWHKEAPNARALRNFSRAHGVGGKRKQPEDLRLSDRGVAFITRWEGFRAEAYEDAAGHATIGVGHLLHRGKLTPADKLLKWSREKAMRVLREDASSAANAVRDAVKVPITQNEFDALVSFAFNVGNQAFRDSTLVKRLNENQRAKAGREFLRWNKAGGKVLLGLSRRRRAERALFRSK